MLNGTLPATTPTYGTTHYQYGTSSIRTLLIDGEPWFVLADLTKVLGIRQFRADRLDDGVIRNHPVLDGLGRTQQTSIVSEAGMYEVVIRSDKPEAARFRRWITAEVLPSIRKTGGYNALPALSEDEIVAQALAITTRKVEALTAKVAELEPKAELADQYLTASEGSRLVREVAKILKVRESVLREFLLVDGLIFPRRAGCGREYYDFKAQFAPHFETHETVVNHTWGSCAHYTLRITPRGVDLIRRRLSRSTVAAV
ncbi:phage antirepressor Ant [Prescottella equi]|uniref:phage antirepressor KilAC domain-containing protein n=1 Tax=Rhodococcus hoagii TaxID=43767 RepID=UPI001163D823|nr:phage antirepressor KilAC domain-containing protein [Prescottella equi]QDP09769.1 phage antirepressor Ant [Prescottella equi]